MIEPNKIYTASGITARLFDIILTLSEPEKRRLLDSLGFRQRKSPRIPFLMQVDFETTGSQVHPAYIQDISSEGVFLETMTPVEMDSAIQIHFQFQEFNARLTLAGKVVRKSAEGMGVSFTGKGDGSRQRLREIIELL